MPQSITHSLNRWKIVLFIDLSDFIIQFINSFISDVLKVSVDRAAPSNWFSLIKIYFHRCCCCHSHCTVFAAHLRSSKSRSKLERVTFVCVEKSDKQNMCFIGSDVFRS